MRDVRTSAMDAWMDLWGNPHGAGPAQTGTATASPPNPAAPVPAPAEPAHEPLLPERAWAGVRDAQAAHTAATEQDAQAAGGWAGRAMHAVNSLGASVHDALPDGVRHGLDQAESARESVAGAAGTAWNWAGDHIDTAAKAADGIARKVGTAVDGAADQAIASGTDAVRRHVGGGAADVLKSGADALHGQVRAGVQFQYGVTTGVLAEGASMVSGVGHLAGEAYELGVDPAAREQAASALARNAVRLEEDPTGVAAGAAAAAYHAGAGWVQGAKDASAHGGLPEYLGNSTGHLAAIAATVVAPEALLGKAGEVTNMAGRVGDATGLAGRTEEVATAGATVEGTATAGTADVISRAAETPAAETARETAAQQGLERTPPEPPVATPRPDDGPSRGTARRGNPPGGDRPPPADGGPGTPRTDDPSRAPPGNDPPVEPSVDPQQGPPHGDASPRQDAKGGPPGPGGDPPPPGDGAPPGDGPPPWKPCFLAGTIVHARGRETPIEDVEVGDEVLGSHAGSLATAGHRVSDLVRGVTEVVVRVSVANSSLLATRGHPFHVVDRGWRKASELQVGDTLTEAAGLALRVSGIEQVRLDGQATTYNLTVEDVSTYLVRLGGGWALVHNDGSNPYGQVLYWFFGKKPNLRNTDTDGLSVWKTTSKEEVDALMSHRVNVDHRPPTDPHGYFTEADLETHGLVAPATQSDNALARKLPHHSLRPKDAPAYPAELTERQMEAAKDTLAKAPAKAVKPKELPC